MTDNENTVGIKFSFLCIIDRCHMDYDKISSEIRRCITNCIALLHGKDRFVVDGNLDDHESWYTWSGTIPIPFEDSGEDCSIVIKHFKVRIIIEVIRGYKAKDFVTLFKKARKGRELMKKNTLIGQILKITIPDHVRKIYYFPFIHILREYVSTDFDQLGDESITSFSYEIHDARREDIFSLFLWRPKITLIRVSRPSLIATKMSNFMQSEIINAIYDTCLNSLREKKIEEPTDDVFRDMQHYIGRVLFTHEETVASAELNRSVNTLSIIMSIGAIAGILALITITLIPLPDLGSLNPKSFLGHILFFVSIIILTLAILNKNNKYMK